MEVWKIGCRIIEEIGVNGLKDADLIFSKIVFELTRKCNMNCIHCAKGCSQNIVITKEIIDKTLDTVEHNKIYEIELFGGEPTLEPDIIEYLVNEIIKRKIMLSSFDMSTNGLVASKKVIESFNKLGKYLNEQSELYLNYQIFVESKMSELSKKDREMVKYFKEGSPCSIQISTYDHGCRDLVYNNYLFYKNNANEFVSVKWQEEYHDYIQDRDDKETLYIYMGNAVKNYEGLSKKHNFRIKNKRGSLRKASSNLIDVPIYICANGNVVNSSLISYEMEDNPDDYICNILTDNLFKKMDEWNFKYPLDHKQRHDKEWCLTEIFNYEHGVKQIYKNHPEYQITEEEIEEDKQKLEIYNLIEKTKVSCHKEFPYLTYDEIQFLGDSILELKTEGVYLSSPFSGYEKSNNYVYDKEDFLESIKAYQTINNQRKSESNLERMDKFLDLINLLWRKKYEK